MSNFLAAVRNRTQSVMSIDGFPVILLVNVFLGIAFSFVLPFNSMFGIDEIGMSNTAFGVFMMVSTLCGVGISTYIGKLSDRASDRKMILILCALAGAIGYIGFAYSRNYYVLLAISAIFLGIASSTFPQVFAYGREVLVKAKLPAKEIPFYMNILRVLFALSWTVGPAIAAYVLLYFGFKGMFLVAASCYIIVVGIVLLSLKKTSKEKAAPKPPQASVPLRQVIFQPFIFVNLIAFTLISVANTIGSLNMAQFVTKVLNGEEKDIGIIFSIPPVFEIPFMLGFGILALRIKSDNLIRLGSLLAFAYFGAIFFATEIWHIFPIQILSAAYISITSGIAITYFQDFIPEMPGTATALYSNTSKIGSLLGFLLFGLLSDAFGYRNVYLWCAIFAFVAMVMLFALVKAKRVQFDSGSALNA
ncbi:sugar efflux transporter [Paenibacillus sp. FJAT-26967]|uniref:sugar efflux transporter n=1 Tax=Paenibacillus sp. FJAT-26967 TaxID=1729690 RepID=UPI0008398297|nr:sugar efflux transporter [Paenibacillus sp. FJAT-26967]